MRVGTRQLADTIKLATNQNWKVEATRKGHLRFTPPDPDKEQVICSGTPSDTRAHNNALAQLRRNGLVIPNGKGKKGHV